MSTDTPVSGNSNAESSIRVTINDSRVNNTRTNFDTTNLPLELKILYNSLSPTQKEYIDGDNALKAIALDRARRNKRENFEILWFLICFFTGIIIFWLIILLLSKSKKL
ncbi:hypothetical protein C1645_873013 [Glomus cerebriforme]|uniref:Uncharacterized protein n=1 Tax=Glomus cerebriforme TaxID=658196 RepID=A0A397TAZ7_9GLOM|nr:hypothetical protein C1645_873013 [Glomus cerebriforme]